VLREASARAMTAHARQRLVLGLLGLTVWSLVLGGAGRSQPDRAVLTQSRAAPDAEEQAWFRASQALLDPVLLSALAPPDDPAYSASSGDYFLQWPLHALNAVSAWALYPGAYFDADTRPTDAPIIALIDTGVDPSHPDFMNPGATSAEVADGGQLLLSASRTFLSWEGEPQEGATDEHGHGTHLAGLIAAATNNGETAGSGIAGMAYPIRLLPIKVTDESGVATHTDLASAITYAADQGASVIAIGVAGPTWSQTLQDAVDYAWDRGCFIIAPAGDTAAEQPMFPAACPHVFGVAPTTAAGALAWYATSGDHVALAAPGGDETVPIYSTLPTYACTLRSNLGEPPYGSLFGSAQAAAHVAAAAGLWVGLNGAAADTGDDNRLLWQALQRSAAPLPGADQERWDSNGGYGLVALYAVLSGEKESPPQAGCGSVVGRVVADGSPVLGAQVAAVPAMGETANTQTLWPAGAYRLANLPEGVYTVSVSADGQSGVWEGTVVEAGCDTPGVDFHLGSPAADADLVSALLPAAAVCGRETPISITFRNSGAGAWERRQGYCLRYVGDAGAVTAEESQWDLPAAADVATGQSHEFPITWRAPTQYGFYELAFQMCQQGGVGRFGEVAGASVSVSSFLDVAPDHWAIAAVEAAKAAGIVGGYAGDLYHPYEPVTRAAMAVYIARAMAGGDGAVPTGPATATFPDVPTDQWAFKYVEYCCDQDVVGGYSDGYHPDERVTRGQMAVFVARAMVTPHGDEGLAGYIPPTTPTFPDVPTDYWSYKYVEYIASQAVTGGYEDHTYRPSVIVNRDAMAVYVSRAFGLGV